MRDDNKEEVTLLIKVKEFKASYSVTAHPTYELDFKIVSYEDSTGIHQGAPPYELVVDDSFLHYEILQVEIDELDSDD